MNNITRPNTPTVPRLELNTLRNSYECDACGKVALHYIAMTVKDRQKKHYCSHNCFRAVHGTDICHNCEKVKHCAFRVLSSNGQLAFCGRECYDSYKLEVFN